MVETTTTSAPVKKNWVFIIGVLILSIGMQFANYGTAVCVSGDVGILNASQYYVLISALGSLGMMLVLPVVGRLTGVFGMRTLILIGIIIQTGARVLMMFSGNWITYSAAYLLQSVGTGCYVSSAHTNLATAVEPHERAKFFGYIAVFNAIGAMTGPILISAMYSAGGLMGKLAYIGNLPFTLVGFLLMFKNCSNKKTPNATKGFDFPGLFLSVIFLACMVLWMNLGGKMFAWASMPSIIMLVVTVASFIILFKREMSIANPAVPLKMFKNPRLTASFICAVVASAYSTCSGSYCVKWVRENFQGFPASTFYNGTATMVQQLTILILGLFLGAYIGRKFVKRFRAFGILSMIAAMIACAILYCLKFTGTAAGGDLMVIGGTIPVGMIVIYIATVFGGFASCVSQSTYPAFWQTNTPREELAAGQALYTFGASGGSVIFGSVVGVVLGASGDYTRAFATGFVFAVIGLIVALVGFKFTKEEIEAAK